MTTLLQLSDVPVAVIFVLAMASVGIYGIVLGRLVVRFDILAARRPPIDRPDDQVGGLDGPVVRRRLPVRGLSYILDRVEQLHVS